MTLWLEKKDTHQKISRLSAHCM